MKKIKQQTTQKEKTEIQLSLDFSFEKDKSVGKNNETHNAKIVSFQHFEDINRRELLRHIIHKEKSF